MDDNGFTLHRRLWRLYRRLPRVVQIWVVLALIGALAIELPALLSATNQTERVKDAVSAAVREATSDDPSSSCSALSPAGLDQVVGQFGGGSGLAAGPSPLTACQQLVVRLRAQASPFELADFARGVVRAVQFRADGSALALFVAADRHLAVQLTLSQSRGLWLIDSVAAGTIAS